MMLAGRTILITGAAGGLGRAAARACAAAGARLVLADLDLAGAQQIAAETGGRAAQVDLGEPDSIAALAASVAATEGGLDGLLNNGAVATNVGGMGFEEIEIDLWDRVQRVNVRGTWLMTRAAKEQIESELAQVAAE